MRFDDSLETVLSAEMSSTFGAQSTWRQLVDLVGRGRAGVPDEAIRRLRLIRADVPPPVRAASARALAFASPPAALVALFAEDEIAVASPVLRAAMLRPEEWTALLPAMSPTARSILRHRRDLPPAVERALESFGSVDFVLGAPPAEIVVEAPVAEQDLALPVAPEPEPLVADSAVPLAIDWTEVAGDVVDQAEPPALDAGPAAPPEPVAAVEMPPPVEQPAEPLTIDWTEVVPEASDPDPVVAEAQPESHPAKEVAEPTELDPPVPAIEPLAELPETIAPVSPFVSIASVAAGLPVVAEALRKARQPDIVEEEAPVATVVHLPAPVPEPAPPPAPASDTGPFRISELLVRIDAYQRRREAAPPSPPPEIQPELFAHEPVQAQAFRFETDATGVIRWIEGAARAPLIGLSLDLAAQPGGARVDGVAAGAFRRRAGFANARLVVDGLSDAAGQWRITGIPVFDRATGRFTGYRGTARRPRPDESAEPVREARNPAADALRQLVHELRTPTNAIAGFAEMIEQQLLGPVPAAYRAHAAAIRGQASGLLGAIDDIDMAARIETQALDLRPGDVPVAPLLARICADLAPLAALRGATVDSYVGAPALAILGDDRAVERLIARVLATLVAAAGPGERVGVSATLEEGMVALVLDRPAALAAYSEEALLTIDAEAEAERVGAPLLGTGFALRLARNLAGELHGSLAIDARCLTLRLPAAEAATMEQVSSS